MGERPSPRVEQGVSKPDIKLVSQITAQDIERIAAETEGSLNRRREDLDPEEVSYLAPFAMLDFMGNLMSFIDRMPEHALKISKEQFELINRRVIRKEPVLRTPHEFKLKNGAVIIGKGSVTFVLIPGPELQELDDHLPYIPPKDVEIIIIKPNEITFKEVPIKRASHKVKEAVAMIDETYRARLRTVQVK